VWSRAALMPGDEGAQAVVAASRQASEGLAAEDSTLGFARRYLLLLDGYLHRSESSERLILVRELRRLSDDVPVAWRVRSSWLHELHELARAEGDEALVKETREARLVLNKASADAARGRSVVRGDVRDREIGLDEVGNMARKLLVGDPTNAYLLFYEYYRRGSLTQKGEDAALCAFGLRPRNLLRRLYSSVYYSTSVTKQDTFGGSTFLRQVQQRLDSGDLSPLPSKHLRCQAPRVLWRPFLVGHAFAVGLEPTPARLVRVLAEAEQAVLFAPRLSATLQVLGWLRLAAGDGAGARRAFAHARSQLVVFPTAVVEHEGFLLHLSARTYAAEGRHEEAAELLRQARQKAGAHVLSPQVDWIQPVVEFRVDPTDPKSQLAEAIQKLRDEKRGR
jgi:tetratricopeptide (TPR) repeat protein